MRAEKKQLIERNTSADVVVKTPNTLKMAASRLGYTGVKIAEGPVFPQKGLEKPWPIATERAIWPISKANSQ